MRRSRARFSALRFFIIDGEPFWGADRLDHVERWLATGGW